MSNKTFIMCGLVIVAAVMMCFSTVASAKKIDVTRVNMLSNYGFEEGTDLAPVDWKFVNVHEAMQGFWANGEGIDSSTCLKIKAGGWLSYGWWKTTYRIILEPGKQYTIGGYHRGDEAIAVLNGYPVDFNSAQSSYSRQVDKTYNRNLKIEASEDWQPFEQTFGVPDWGHPIWAEVKLQAGGKAQAYFDNLYVVGGSCALVAPKVPQVVKPGATMNLAVALSDGEANAVSNDVNWTVSADEAPLEIVDSSFNSASTLWNMEVVVPDKVGAYDLTISAKWLKRGEATSTKGKFLSVNVNEDKMFSFAVFADPHINAYPDDNPQNQQFMQMVNTLNQMKPLFAIGVGDLRGISNGLGDILNKYRCAGYEYMSSHLDIPVYNIAGNHDTDKTDEGVQSRWYYTHYMENPLYYSFDVANFHFVGIDTNTVDIYGKDHQGSFSLPGQKEWLEADLAKANDAGKFIVIYFHEPVYEGSQFIHNEKREEHLDLFYKNNVKLVLTGHNHHNWIVTKKNPYKTRSTNLEEISVNPDEPDVNVDIYQYYNDPLFTIFEQTTTVSAFLMRGSKYFGYRYIVVRDGKVAYDDSLPLSFTINSLEDTPSKKVFEISLGDEKSLTAIPIKFTMAKGEYQVLVNGKQASFTVVSNGDVNDVWVPVDVAANGSITIEVSLQ